MKVDNWMKWDLDSRSGLKMSAFFSEFGATGYGVFLFFTESLYRDEDHQLGVTPSDYNAYSSACKVSIEEIRQILNSLFEYGLFQFDGDHFWSNRVLDEIEIRKEKLAELKGKKSEAGKLGAKKRWKDNGNLIADDGRSIAQNSRGIASDGTGIAKIARVDKIRSDKIFLGVEAPAPEKVLEKKQTREEIREIVSESLASAKLGKELDALTAQETSQPMESPSLKLKNGTALNVGDNFIDLNDQITSNQMFVSLGRRPLKKYPEIWITPLELKYVLDTAFDKKIEAKEVFAQVSSFVKQRIASGEQLNRINSVPALTGWGLQEALKLQTAEIRRDNQKNFNKPEQKENNHYKNFKVYK